MGKLFQPDTWRAPLRLIECWLPEPEVPARKPSSLTGTLVEKFTRAGWLGSHAANAPRIATGTNELLTPLGTPNASRVRVVRAVDKHTQASGRVVVAGRIADVCAELDRLVELESRRAKVA